MRNSLKKAKVGDIIYSFNLLEGYKRNIIIAVYNVPDGKKTFYLKCQDDLSSLVIEPSQYKNDYICKEYTMVSLDLKKLINLLDRQMRSQDNFIQENINMIDYAISLAKKDLDEIVFFNRKVGDNIYVFDKNYGYSVQPIAIIERTPSFLFFYFKQYCDIVIPYEDFSSDTIMTGDKIISTTSNSIVPSMIRLREDNEEKIQKIKEENNFITKEIHKICL